MAALGYARRGRPGEALRALGDFLNPTVRDGLFEWTDILPGLAYYRSLLANPPQPPARAGAPAPPGAGAAPGRAP